MLGDYSASRHGPGNGVPGIAPGLSIAVVLSLLCACAALLPGDGVPPAQRGAKAPRIAAPGEFEIRLPTRRFTPAAAAPDWERLFASATAPSARAIVQLQRIPTDAERAGLADAGVVLGQPLTGNAFVAAVRRELRPDARTMALVRSAEPWRAQDKLAPELGLPSPWARRVAGRLDLVVKLFADVDFERAVQALEAAGATVTGRARTAGTVAVSVPAGREADLARLDEVRYIEPDSGPMQGESDRARSHVGADVGAIAAGRPDGTGVTVGVFDGAHASSTHPDFGARSAQGDTGTFNPQIHPTMTAGIIAGDGTRASASGAAAARQWRGLAPAATIRSYSFTTTATAITDFINDVTDAVQNDGVSVLNNSWGDFGCATLPYGAYVGRAPFLDDVVRGSLGRPVTVVFSAGNERDGFFVSNANQNDPGCILDTAAPFANYVTVNHPKAAKNVLAVGAVDSANNAMSDYSSWGPTLDGRIKPEIVASGQHNGTLASGVSRIDNPFGSPNPGDSNQQGYRTPNHPTTTFEYAWFTQTSSAAAVVSGGVALMIDAWRRTFPGRADPLPSTVRALLVHNAQDLDDGTTWYNPGPDYASGYGLVRFNETIASLERGDAVEGSVPNGSDARFFVSVAAGAPLKVTLAWDDPAAIEGANPTLINDLDLIVLDPGGTRHFPWTLDPANPTASAVRTQADSVNNIEQVLVDAPVAGTWSVTVRGTRVVQGRQNFSVVVAGGLARQPVDLVLALDTSGSMSSPAGTGANALPRIEVLRRSATLLLETWRLHALPDDRVGLASFSDNVSTTPNAIPALQPLLPNFAAVSGAINTLTASGCTAFGGALQVALSSLPSTATNKRAIVALTDGMQSANPFVGETGTPSQLRIETFAAAANLPFGAFFCTTTPANGPGGAPITPDGSTLASHGVEMHAIGIGVNGPGFQQLIERVASENRGLHHFTTQPDANLDLLFINDLVRALKSNTLEIILTDSGPLAVATPKRLTFPVNGTARSVTVVLSWRGAQQAGAVSARVLAPGGGAIAPSQTRQQAGFTLLKFDLPGAKGARPGVWTLTLERAAAPAVDYQLSIIADESCLHYDFGVPSATPAGTAPRLAGSISAGGRPLQALPAVRATIAAPAEATGNLLAAWVPKTRAWRRYSAQLARPGTAIEFSAAQALEAAMVELGRSPSFAKALQRKTSLAATLKPSPTKIDPTSGGSTQFSAVLPALARAGAYEVLWQIDGPTACGPARREERTTISVYPGKLEPAKSAIGVTRVSATLSRLTVKPVDAFGNLLGPGAAASIRASVEGLEPAGPVLDRLDGRYEQLFRGKPRPRHGVKIDIGGDPASLVITPRSEQ